MNRLKIVSTGIAMLLLVFPAVVAADTKPVQEQDEIIQTQPASPVKSISNTTVLGQPASPLAYQLNWLSINGGGAINASSTNYQLGLSVGQSVAGFASSPSYQMGIGFWYGAGGAPACAKARGDLNGNTSFDPSDVTLLLLCVFTGTSPEGCDLCFADVNCNYGVDPPDVVIELLTVFVGDPLPACP